MKMYECCDPCPWCGSEVEMYEVEIDDSWVWTHYCPDEKTCGWKQWMYEYATKEEWENRYE